MINIEKIKKNLKTISLSVLGGLGAGLIVASPSFATGGTTTPAADYETIIETATTAVTNLGGLAMVAFGAAIAPFIGRVAMISISSVFKSL